MLLHLKKDQLLLFIWIILSLFISGAIGRNMGISLLFLDPEYLGKVSFWSFFIMGVALGGLIVTWNITSYMLNSNRFPFLASLEYPLWHFSFNNFIIPLAFVLFYSIMIVRFQFIYELKLGSIIFFRVEGLLAGILTVFLLTTLYFYLTNKNILIFLKQSKGYLQPVKMKDDKDWKSISIDAPIQRVEYFLSKRFKVRPVRDVSHYDDQLLLSVFRQHQNNAFFIQIITLLILIVIGFFIDVPLFQIPAAASLMLLCSIAIVIAGAVSYWLGNWKVSLFILVIVIANFLTSYDLFSHKNAAYGINYNTSPADYSMENLKVILSEEEQIASRNNTIEILETWKKNVTQLTGKQKPEMIIANFSGGGMGASFWAMRVMQKVDSISQGKLMQHTTLLTGASGGMFGASYLRELYYQYQLGENVNYRDIKYAFDISNDLLNPIIFTFVVNDLFFPWQKYKVGEYEYIKDRGYSFERKFSENTRFMLDKKLMFYQELEKQAVVPMMILNSTIMNDKRRLMFSAQPIAFMCQPYHNSFQHDKLEIDAVDFNALFKEQDAKNLKLTSALRMNGTFPYIFPSVFLPSEPVIEVMDAGVRDNYGLETTYRFISQLKEWINENVSEVIVLDIRSQEKIDEIEDRRVQRLLGKLLNPLQAVHTNYGMLQDYTHDSLAAMANDLLDGKLNILTFEYRPQKGADKASMSLHLTEKEKQAIESAILFDYNQISVQKLTELLK